MTTPVEWARLKHKIMQARPEMRNLIVPQLQQLAQRHEDERLRGMLANMESESRDTMRDHRVTMRGRSVDRADESLGLRREALDTSRELGMARLGMREDQMDFDRGQDRFAMGIGAANVATSIPFGIADMRRKQDEARRLDEIAALYRQGAA
jgi:hypothetical protein